MATGIQQIGIGFVKPRPEAGIWNAEFGKKPLFHHSTLPSFHN
ncbi:hypothetical protein D1AOALGA4SA_1363 [Olavius algarvensis Delta 1 endosymbiont]|nr:hypothetical protein D1AOALGA4SA_1363 [Olavius algarvensis Delta 1 endosymbiont]